MSDEFFRSTHEYSEARAQFQASQSKIEVAEQQVAAWRDERCAIIIKGQSQEDKFEAEFTSMKTELATMSQELATLCSKAAVSAGN